MSWVEIGFLMLVSCIVTKYSTDGICILFKIQTIEKTKIQKFNANTILNWWIIILFIASIINQWFWCKYIFGLSLVIRSLWAIKDTLTHELKIFRWLAIIEFVVAVGLGCYLIYTIPEPEMKTIVLQISASTFGGLITLVGVSWTIIAGRKEQNEIQRKQIKPIIYSINPLSHYDSDNLEDIIINDGSENKKKIFFGIIHNTDNGIFIINSAMINNAEYPLQRSIVLRKNMPAQIILFINNDIEVKTFSIVGTDIQNNKIEYEIIFIKDDNNKYKIDYIVEKQ